MVHPRGILPGSVFPFPKEEYARAHVSMLGKGIHRDIPKGILAVFKADALVVLGNGRPFAFGERVQLHHVLWVGKPQNPTRVQMIAEHVPVSARGDVVVEYFTAIGMRYWEWFNREVHFS